MRGHAVSAARDAVDVIGFVQFQGKIVENMRRVSKSGEKHDRAPRSTPVEHLETNIRFDCNELNVMGRGIRPYLGRPLDYWAQRQQQGKK
jgi:hypothetical protein